MYAAVSAPRFYFKTYDFSYFYFINFYTDVKALLFSVETEWNPDLQNGC